MVDVTGPALLAGEGLRRAYGGRLVLEVDRIALYAGRVLALLGPNGAGKSTLVRCLAGLERPDAGRVLFRGAEVRPGDLRLRRACAVVFQRPALWSGTVRENVEYGLRVRRVPARERRARVDAALESWGLADRADAPAASLSGGEARRVALARALVLDPEVLLLDEPTSDLDVDVHRRLVEDLERTVRASGRAVLLVTHSAADAFALGDRIAILESGRIVQEGAPEEIFEAPATAFAASLTGAEFLLRGRVERADGEDLAVRLDGGALVEARGRAAPGTTVRVAYRPEDVALTAPGAAPPASPRNRFDVEVAAVRPLGSFVRLRLAGPGLTLVALVTRHALDELGLEVGRRAVAQIKATALHAFESGPGDEVIANRLTPR